MITAKLKRIVPLEPNAKLEIKDQETITEFQVLEFQPGPSKRYMITAEIGNMPPREAHLYLTKMRDQLKGFFPEGTYIISPVRNGQPANGIYEIEIQ